MTDQGVLVRKLTSLQDHTGRLKRRRTGDLASFKTDVDRQDALCMSLLVAIQDALDIALHIASDAGWGVPASYGEGFTMLADHAVIDRALAADLAAMAALRNRLAHGYASVDPGRLWNELPEGLVALDTFAMAMARRLGPGANPANSPA